MRLRFYTLDVFTELPFGGNPLAVFPDATGLSEELMQKVTSEFNISECVFVFASTLAGAAKRMRIFTPGGELPFAGHPTIGTAALLGILGELAPAGEVSRITFEQAVGPIEVSVRDIRAGSAFAELSVAQLPEEGAAPPAIAKLAAALRIDAADIVHDGDQPESWSCGVPFLFVPVTDRHVLAEASLDPEAWRRFIGKYWAPHIYVFCRDAQTAGASIRARMFAPKMNIKEDPATGAAVAAMAGYLARREGGGNGTQRWLIEQGAEIGRPSLLRLEADMHAGAIRAVRVGGYAVLMSEGEFHLA